MSSEPPAPAYRRRSGALDGAVPPPPPPPAEPRRRPTAGRVVAGIVGVTGELLLTAGALVLLYLGWQLYLNNAIVGDEQTEQARTQSETWAAAYTDGPVVVDVPKTAAAGSSGAVPVYGGAPANAEVFGTLIVPRFGTDWTRPIAEGVGVEDVLNPIGIGHYPGTAMPGEVGNFAVAAHRTGHGSAFIDINQLDVGDSIYVETADGWYRYMFRAHEYVLPTGVEVLAAAPQLPEVQATDRVLTLTSCNPLHSVAERYIAYAVFDSWTPRSAGPPAEIAHLYKAA